MYAGPQCGRNGKTSPPHVQADGEFMINISTSLSDSVGLLVNSLPIEKETFRKTGIALPRHSR